MQALVSEELVSLFGFQGAGKAHHLNRGLNRGRGGTVFPGRKQVKRRRDKAFFAYFLSRKKVSAFSSVGRATDS